MDMDKLSTLAEKSRQTKKSLDDAVSESVAASNAIDALSKKREEAIKDLNKSFSEQFSALHAAKSAADARYTAAKKSSEDAEAELQSFIHS